MQVSQHFLQVMDYFGIYEVFELKNVSGDSITLLQLLCGLPFEVRIVLFK